MFYYTCNRKQRIWGIYPWHKVSTCTTKKHTKSSHRKVFNKVGQLIIKVKQSNVLVSSVIINANIFCKVQHLLLRLKRRTMQARHGVKKVIIAKRGKLVLLYLLSCIFVHGKFQLIIKSNSMRSSMRTIGQNFSSEILNISYSMMNSVTFSTTDFTINVFILGTNNIFLVLYINHLQ